MARKGNDGTPDTAPGASRAWRVARAVGLVVVFCAVSIGIVARALDGDFLSDDYLYIVNNVNVHELNRENLVQLLDPWGDPTAYTLNWAPVHLLLHAVEYHFWGEQTRGYHVVNAILHGLTAALLIPLFRRSGIGAGAALLGAAFFLVHPANVETIAWIFQLKTILSLGLAMGALLLHERRPGLAATLFALAILTKISAAFALPVAIVQVWGRRVRGETTPARWGWLAVWALVLVAVMVPEYAAFDRQADERIVIAADPLAHARTIVAIAMRYLVMAATGYGVATFHEPPAADSWLDPWWLTGLVALAALGWRTVVTLRRGDEEAAWWVFAAASFAPVSQVFPFIFPMGDRYLYGILPGLIGGTILAGSELARRGAPWIARVFGEGDAGRQNARRALGALAVTVLILFTVRSQARSAVFVSMRAMMVDAALAYPDGMQASLLRGHTAAERGDGPAAAAAFQRAVDLGFSDLDQLVTHPGLARVRSHPAFRRMLRDLAARDVERLSRHPDPTQSELYALALAYRIRGDSAQAIQVLERALEMGGPYQRQLQRMLDDIRTNG